MKKRLIVLAAVLTCLTLLTGCTQEKQHYQTLTSAALPTQNVLDFSSSYDSGNTTTLSLNSTWADEVDNTDGVVTTLSLSDPYAEYVEYAPMYEEYTPVETPMPTVRGEYAGATPVVIDPIDKPSPTPAPAIAFEYQVYDANNIHLSFEGPAGWIVTNSTGDTFTISNPATNVDYVASLSVQATKVGSAYQLADLKKEVKNFMNTLSKAFSSFSSSSTAERSMLQSTGVYADYTATMADGVKVAGRVQVCCVDKTLYILHMSVPRAYMENYKDTVYHQFRHSVSIVK